MCSDVLVLQPELRSHWPTPEGIQLVSAQHRGAFLVFTPSEPPERHTGIITASEHAVLEERKSHFPKLTHVGYLKICVFHHLRPIA
ncbi:hypothetical protein EYF80_064184 [Liparis tanakae]|uniref:Uncharacterized protein n=1 Tax=Liparis tanakae TaxID=230148 RepID=A0A4Z2EAA6_9TELE|nr:hypothetical protein EYF80_064184 [Liparis tanakae]